MIIRNKCNAICQLLICFYGYVRFKGRNSVSTHQRRCHQPDSEAGYTNEHFGICH